MRKSPSFSNRIVKAGLSPSEYILSNNGFAFKKTRVVRGIKMDNYVNEFLNTVGTYPNELELLLLELFEMGEYSSIDTLIVADKIRYVLKTTVVGSEIKQQYPALSEQQADIYDRHLDGQARSLITAILKEFKSLENSGWFKYQKAEVSFSEPMDKFIFSAVLCWDVEVTNLK
jgi:hypothetical protein